jgi:hypothetical protein
LFPSLVGAGTGTSSLVVNNPSSLQTGQTMVVSHNVTVTTGGQLTLLTPGSYAWNGSSFVPVGTTTPSPEPAAEDEVKYTVPTLDGGTAQVAQSTPHLYDGVENGAYRYLGVKRGTILVSGSASTVAQPKWTALDTPILALPGNLDIRIAAVDRVFHMSSHYDAVPPGGPKVKALAVDGGAIWLPTDGTEPYFSSGSR